MANPHNSVEIPAHLANRQTDSRGFPIPWFVAPVERGDPDFRLVRPRGVILAYRHDICWICGARLGAHRWFTMGPMCAVNRITSEPPAHLDCAHYAVKACPFLSNPDMRRSPREYKEGAKTPPGFHIDRNPGVTALYKAAGYRTIEVPRVKDFAAGTLLQLGEPVEVEWWARGREATRAEVLASIDSGVPNLRAVAEAEGPEVVRELEICIARVQHILPPE